MQSKEMQKRRSPPQRFTEIQNFSSCSYKKNRDRHFCLSRTNNPGVQRYSSKLLVPASSIYAAPIALRCWKHSRQNTGRPCVGRNGTVVSFPHCEQLVFVSARIGVA
jgi:hypothetical protein